MTPRPLADDVEASNPGRLVTGYRTDADLDPAPPSRRTGLWRSPPRERPENSLTGTQYECFPVDAPFRVVSPRWWGFRRCRHPPRRDASTTSSASRPTGSTPVPDTPRPLQVLAHASYACRRRAHLDRGRLLHDQVRGRVVAEHGVPAVDVCLVPGVPGWPIPSADRALGQPGDIDHTARPSRGPTGGRHPARRPCRPLPPLGPSTPSRPAEDHVPEHQQWALQRGPGLYLPALDTRTTQGMGWPPGRTPELSADTQKVVTFLGGESRRTMNPAER